MADAATNGAPGEAQGAAEAAKGRTLFAYAGFDKLFIGSFCGALADRLYQFSLISAAGVIFAKSASENKVGELQIVATVPLLFLSSLSGALVDRSDRRKLLTR